MYAFCLSCPSASLALQLGSLRASSPIWASEDPFHSPKQESLLAGYSTAVLYFVNDKLQRA